MGEEETMENRKREGDPRARSARLWRVLVAGGMALAAACAGPQKTGSSGTGSGESGSRSGASGDEGTPSGGGGGGAGGW